MMGIFFTVVFLTLSVFIGCSEYNKRISESQTAAAERVIADNPEFRETDEFCRQIPLPEGTGFVEKARLWNSIGLVYFYHSDKQPEELEKFYRDYITKNGWEPVESDALLALTADFKNDKFDVTVTLTGITGNTGEANFAIGCKKLDTKFIS